MTLFLERIEEYTRKKLKINNALYPSFDKNATLVIEPYNAMNCT